MREIKFRGKRIDHERYEGEHKWVKGNYFVLPITIENFDCSPPCLLTDKNYHCIVDTGVCFAVIPETVGQYTGFKDSEGKEIYEGDIVKFGIRESAVSFNPEYGSFDWDNDFLSDIVRGNIKVIGTIHDKGELK